MKALTTEQVLDVQTGEVLIVEKEIEVPTEVLEQITEDKGE